MYVMFFDDPTINSNGLNVKLHYSSHSNISMQCNTVPMNAAVDSEDPYSQLLQ